eukprot:gene17465-20792_t
MSEPALPTVPAARYYDEYHGHKIRDLNLVHRVLRRDELENEQQADLTTDPNTSTRGRPLIWTAGDSSLDNKFWFPDSAPSIGDYAQILSPPISVQDVTFWLNVITAEAGLPYAAINTAVEATTLGSRCGGRLLDQDKFLRDNVRAEDVVVVSVGGNDIALAPAPCTVCNMLGEP